MNEPYIETIGPPPILVLEPIREPNPYPVVLRRLAMLDDQSAAQSECREAAGVAYDAQNTNAVPRRVIEVGKPTLRRANAARNRESQIWLGTARYRVDRTKTKVYKLSPMRVIEGFALAGACIMGPGIAALGVTVQLVESNAFVLLTAHPAFAALFASLPILVGLLLGVVANETQTDAAHRRWLHVLAGTTFGLFLLVWMPGFLGISTGEAGDIFSPQIDWARIVFLGAELVSETTGGAAAAMTLVGLFDRNRAMTVSPNLRFEEQNRQVGLHDRLAEGCAVHLGRHEGYCERFQKAREATILNWLAELHVQRVRYERYLANARDSYAQRPDIDEAARSRP